MVNSSIYLSIYLSMFILIYLSREECGRVFRGCRDCWIIPGWMDEMGWQEQRLQFSQVKIVEKISTLFNKMSQQLIEQFYEHLNKQKINKNLFREREKQFSGNCQTFLLYNLVIHFLKWREIYIQITLLRYDK